MGIFDVLRRRAVGDGVGRDFTWRVEGDGAGGMAVGEEGLRGEGVCVLELLKMELELVQVNRVLFGEEGAELGVRELWAGGILRFIVGLGL